MCRLDIGVDTPYKIEGSIMRPRVLNAQGRASTRRVIPCKSERFEGHPIHCRNCTLPAPRRGVVRDVGTAGAGRRVAASADSRTECARRVLLPAGGGYLRFRAHHEFRLSHVEALRELPFGAARWRESVGRCCSAHFLASNGTGACGMACCWDWGWRSWPIAVRMKGW